MTDAIKKKNNDYLICVVNSSNGNITITNLPIKWDLCNKLIYGLKLGNQAV